LLVSAGIYTAFQIAWFWRLTSHNVNYDAISYIGIARHLLSGDIPGSLNGYWSPLVSWCIAAVSSLSSNLTLLGRLVTILSFLLCLPMLYLLTFRLWRSPVLAALTVLWFTTARGIVAFSVYFIGADFLLTAFVLIYFVLLLRCLRQPSGLNWVLLGLPHGAAFLAKAIAMPWLAISTLVAGLLVGRCNLKRSFMYVCAGIAVPLMIWFGWGMVLRSKYEVFTAGYQSKWNLLDQNTREGADRSINNLVVLRDTSRSSDSYMVVDNMFPRSPLWHTRLTWASAPRMILSKERQNLPQALKEIAILVTPGGLLAMILTFLALADQRQKPEAQFILIVFVQTASLIAVYCMLVFDTRYVIPLAPLLMAATVPFVMPGIQNARFCRARVIAVALFVSGTIFFQVHRASPFRSLRQDYQLGCYDAARKLGTIPSCNKLVVIGRGPYQEHGVGWEAGIYASFLAQCRMIAFSPDVPDLDKSDATQRDLLAVEPDAILLFGRKDNEAYDHLVTTTQKSRSDLLSEEIVDPQAGEIGTLMWVRDRHR